MVYELNVYALNILCIKCTIAATQQTSEQSTIHSAVTQQCVNAIS